MPRSFVSAVIAAGGSSRRFGSDKLFALLCGKPVIAHTMLAFEQCRKIDEIIVVSREESHAAITELAEKYSVSKLNCVTAGGYTRTESVTNGVYACSKKARFVAIHDGARPLVTSEIIEEAIGKASRFGAAIAAVKVTSTIKRVTYGFVSETPKRDELYEAQTPQVFDIDLMKAALAQGGKTTDDAALLEAIGVTVHITAGSYRNIKITTAEDLIIAEALLQNSR